jgi:hypothetical protein
MRGYESSSGTLLSVPHAKEYAKDLAIGASIGVGVGAGISAIHYAGTKLLRVHRANQASAVREQNLKKYAKMVKEINEESLKPTDIIKSVYEKCDSLSILVDDTPNELRAEIPAPSKNTQSCVKIMQVRQADDIPLQYKSLASPTLASAENYLKIYTQSMTARLRSVGECIKRYLKEIHDCPEAWGGSAPRMLKQDLKYVSTLRPNSGVTVEQLVFLANMGKNKQDRDFNVVFDWDYTLHRGNGITADLWLLLSGASDFTPHDAATFLIGGDDVRDALIEVFEQCSHILVLTHGYSHMAGAVLRALLNRGTSSSMCSGPSSPRQKYAVVRFDPKTLYKNKRRFVEIWAAGQHTVKA